MPKSMIVKWPDLNIQITADFLDKNPELEKVFWNHLPIQTIQSHALVAGVEMYSWVPIATTVAPRVEEPFDEQPIGTVNFYYFYGLLSIKYGDVTEPLVAPPIAQVQSADIEKLKIAGKEAWESLMYTKKLIKVIFDRGE